MSVGFQLDLLMKFVVVGFVSFFTDFSEEAVVRFSDLKPGMVVVWDLILFFGTNIVQTISFGHRPNH